VDAIISACALYINRATEHAYRFLPRQLSEDVFKSDCFVNAGFKLCAKNGIRLKTKKGEPRKPAQPLTIPLGTEVH
jgi:hypothetical protein